MWGFAHGYIRKEREVRALEEDQKRQKGRIRLMEVADLDAVAKIWLDVNRQAHDFIPAAYWEENFAAVKEMLPSAEVYVWEEKSGAGNPGSQIEDSKAELQGFIGLNGEDVVADIASDYFEDYVQYKESYCPITNEEFVANIRKITNM